MHEVLDGLYTLNSSDYRNGTRDGPHRPNIEIMTGTLFYIQVSDNATVADLKRGIVAQERLPHDRLILILGNNLSHLMNENELSLVDYGVRDGSHVCLFIDPLNDGSSNDSLLTSLDSNMY
ncbi:unnamed protein product [Camellia sinensis]